MGRAKDKSGPLARRPDNSAFKQQRLPAWSPMLTANTVLPFFYLMALICMLLGVWLLLTVQSTREVKLDYTEHGACERCFQMRKNVSFAGEPCTCEVNFSIGKQFKGDVFFYYGLKNFHQNLRRYMDSRDDGQTVGRKNKLKNPSGYCEPFARDSNGVPIAPCGAVANSMFNDTFTLTYHQSSRSIPVPLLRTGLTWYTDKNIKYRNPAVDNLTLAQAFEGTVRPLYWQKAVYELDPDDPNNNGFINDDLIIWMREAAFPNFKKLYGILNRNDNVKFAKGLPSGNYTINITYNFPVQPFRGRKEVVLTTLTWFGGQNHFLPVAYLVTSSLLFLTAVVLTVVWWKFGKKGKNMQLTFQ
ncbi:transmembrane protein 30C [Kryptolebias marmoratus]|uniref:Cell cycle control protein n=1 Tax=Kryptolebias marmoratus TaxID=37003 RepID=A0A3Q2ZJY7_KRYMA|nr:transmembrane protein 30C [Kryptolebias marmoratus]